MNLCSQDRRKQRGYILLTLMLFVALLTIGMLALVQNIETQIKRDRQEEMIHRGVQYSRAVQHFYRKFGRYPNRIEDLETGKERDFKPLHMTDVQMSFVGGAGPPPGLGLVSSGPGASQQDATASQ